MHQIYYAEIQKYSLSCYRKIFASYTIKEIQLNFEKQFQFDSLNKQAIPMVGFILRRIFL